MAAVLLLTLAVLFLGATLAYAFGLGTLIGYASFDFPLEGVPNVIFGGIDSAAIIAIPFYLLVGSIMDKSGMSRRIVDLTQLVFGRLRAGMGLTLIYGSALFGAITGSSVATVSAMGRSLAPMLREDGYRPGYIGALNSVTGTLGIFIPPSIPLVVFGLATGTSIGQLFMAGLAIGLIMIVLVTVAHLAHPRPSGAQSEAAEVRRAERLSIRQVSSRVGTAVPALFLPVVIIGGIYGGYLTPTEAGAMVCVLATLIGVVVYRALTVSTFSEAIYESAIFTSGLLIILAFGAAFSRFLTLSGVSRELGNFVVEHAGGQLAFLLLMNVVVAGVALFVEENTTIVILAPILTPIAVQVGLDPVHFGAIFVTIMSISLWTPPVAPNLFVSAKACDTTFTEMLRPVTYLLVTCGLPLLLIVNVFPQAVLVFAG